MKQTIKFFAAALAIVAAASCSKELANDNTDQALEQELVHKVFTASLNVDEETKTTLHTDGVTVHWTEGDAIRIAAKNTADWSNNLPATNVDETFAVFEGDVVEANSYWALYPASALSTKYYSGWKTDKSTVVLGNENQSLATQYAVDGNFSLVKLGDNVVSSNFAFSFKSDDATKLFFKNVNAFVKVRLAMENAATIVLSSDAVSGIPQSSSKPVLSENAELGGPIIFNFASSATIKNVDIPHPGIVSAGGGQVVTFSNQNNENLKSGVDYYIAIPAVEIEGFTLEVKDSNGKVLQSIKRNSTFYARPNTIYNLGTIEAIKEPKYKQITSASELVDGKTYLIASQKYPGMCWGIYASNGFSVLKDGTVENYTNTHLFVFRASDAAPNQWITDYNSVKVGRWQSVELNKYLGNGGAFDVSNMGSAADIGVFQMGEDNVFRMYTSNASSLYLTSVSGMYKLTVGSPQAEKWYIYEIAE